VAIEIGIIKTLIGTAVATATDGSQRTLQAGDRVYQDEVISTGAAGAVEIEFADGAAMTLGRSSQAILDIEVFNPQDVAQAPADADSDVESLQQALLDGADPSQITDATAAGAGTTGGGNEGIDIVQVIHESQEVTPESGFDTTGIAVEFEAGREEAAIFDDLPVAQDDEVSTDEDVAITVDVLSNDSVGTDGDSITDFNQPANGTVVLNGDGTFTYTPAANFSGEDSFDYTLTDDGNSATATATVNVVAVADAPNLIISVGNEVDNSVSETIDINNVSTTDNGFDVTAYNLKGEVANISTVSGTNHDGFGVSGKASGASTEIGSNKNGSERLEVKFDNTVSSIDVNFAWLSGVETAAYTFYLDGVAVGSGTTAFQSDTVDGVFTLTPGSDFDRVDFTAPLNNTDDYLVNSITFNTVTSYSYEVDVQAGLTDVDGSESLSGVSITGLPTGVTIAETPNSDGTYNPGTLTLVSDHELSGAEINSILGSVTSTDGSDTATTNSNAKVETDHIDFAELSLVSWGGSSQDRAPDSDTIVGANVLALAGNSWKAVSLTELGVTNSFDWSKGTLTFEAKVTAVGELQGILFENNLSNNSSADQPNLIKVSGTQTWGTNAAFDSESLDDGWVRIEVDLSALNQSTGTFSHIVFVNDDDNAGNGTGEIAFRNLEISDNAIDSDAATDQLLEGTSGNDFIYGSDGDDIIFGGTGSDSLTGGAGADMFVWNKADADSSHDTVIDFNAADGDVLNLSDLLSDSSHTIEGMDNGSGDLQVNIKDNGGNVVQEIELTGLASGLDVNLTLQSLLDSGAINDGI